MTDADTLIIAFFRQEFQIAPYQARILLGLYNASGSVTLADLADRMDMSVLNLGPGLFELRSALGDEYISPNRREAVRRRGHRREDCAFYRLTTHGREEINRMLRLAITDLSQRLGLGRIAA